MISALEGSSEGVTLVNDELREANANAFALAAIAYVRVQAAHPELFGTLNWQDEQHENQEANEALAQLRADLDEDVAEVAASPSVVN